MERYYSDRYNSTNDIHLKARYDISDIHGKSRSRPLIARKAYFDHEKYRCISPINSLGWRYCPDRFCDYAFESNKVRKWYYDDHRTCSCCPPKREAPSANQFSFFAESRLQNESERCHSTCKLCVMEKNEAIMQQIGYTRSTPNEKFKQQKGSGTAAQRLHTVSKFLHAVPKPGQHFAFMPKAARKKRFQCLYCDKSFGKSSHLRDHHRTHSGERPFPCSYCGKAFSQFSNLRTHIRIHTGEKPFTCRICQKSFTQRVTLRSHLRTHGLTDTDEQPKKTPEKIISPLAAMIPSRTLPQVVRNKHIM